MKLKDLLYILGCLFFTVIIGAAIYEHLVIWPTAYAAPPSSLTMFQGEFGMEAAIFWQMIHPVVLLLFIINTILTWKSTRRMHVVIPFVTYILILVITSIYFVPELIDIISTPYAESIDEDLVSRGSRWEILSIIRLLVLILVAIILYQGLTKKTD